MWSSVMKEINGQWKGRKRASQGSSLLLIEKEWWLPCDDRFTLVSRLRRQKRSYTAIRKERAVHSRKRKISTLSWLPIANASRVWFSNCLWLVPMRLCPVNRCLANPGDLPLCDRNTIAIAYRDLVDPAWTDVFISKIKPCMYKYKRFIRETANGSL